jgi:release factor glutamine methyltransferase
MIYTPKEDSFLMEEQVKRFAKGKTVLDVGSGSGIQALAAKNSGAKSVIASDINPEVIIHLKKQGLNAIESDLFEKIKGKFDLIIFNPPYLPEDEREDKESKLTTTGGKEGDEVLIKFLKQVKEHLNPNGTVLILLSSLTPRDRILRVLEKNALKHEIISFKKIFMETLEVWKIEEK